jgi:hypothetical protein
MKTLRVRLCPLAELGAETLLDYDLLDDKRRVVRTDRAVPGALPRLARTELVVAAPDVLLIDAALPPLSGARLRAALLAIAEPHILTDVATAYVVAGKRLGSRATLAVLDRVLLQRALEVLRRVKIAPESAAPEQLTLALTEGRWRVRLHGAYACVRMAEMRGIACAAPSEGEPPVELKLALEQAGEARPQAIEVEGSCDRSPGARRWASACWPLRVPTNACSRSRSSCCSTNSVPASPTGAPGACPWPWPRFAR